MGIPEPNVTVNPGDVEKGAKIFKTKCAQCHNADQVPRPEACWGEPAIPLSGGKVLDSMCKLTTDPSN